jgi:hypothetical protein
MPFLYGFDDVWKDEDGGSVEEPGPALIVVQNSEFTMTWNEGVGADEYRVYQRERGSGEWSLLESVVGVPELTVNDSMLSYGEYEFAVTTVQDGVESGFHTSLDKTADPATGWYLSWEPAT